MSETKKNDPGNKSIDAGKDQKGNRIQVSNTKKPLSFYLNLAKKHLKIHDEVEVSALGMAIPTVVIISEILKRNGLAVEKSISTATVTAKDVKKGRTVQKARIEIVMIKKDKAGLENGQG